MAKASIKTMAIALLSIIALLTSCTKEYESPLAGTGRYHSGPVIEDVEIIKEFNYHDQRMRFVEGKLENSFLPYTVTDVREIPGSRVSERFNVNAKGVEVQYFEPKTENFEEKEGAQSELETKVLDHNNGWVENFGGKVYSWDAINTDDDADCPYTYRDSVWTSSSSYVFVPDSLSGYEVKFPAVNVKVEAGEEKTEEVSGVAYNGKTWEALKVSYPSVVTMTIPEEFRMKGEQYEMTFDIVNVVFYLRHEVDTKVENLLYEVNIIENILKIDKEYQTLTFDLVTRDNGEVKESNSYKLEENFDITAVKVEDVEVFSEDALKDTKVTLTKGSITGKTSSEDIFTKTTYTGSDKATMTDGRSTDVTISYEGYSWGDVKFPYASVISRKAELKSVENVSESTSSKKVYDVTLTLSYDVKYNNTDKKDETKVIVITYKRFYNVPDELTQTVTATNFELQYVQPNEAEMGTSVERNTVLVQKFNHGEFVSDSTYTHDAELSAKLARTSSSQVKVENVQDLTVTLQAKGGYKTTYSQKDENGIQNMQVSRKYDVKVSDGSTYELVIYDEKPRRNGEDFGNHAEFNDAAFQPIVALQPTLNPGASTQTEKVYDVKVSVSMPIDRTDKVATKAANSNADVFTVSASHQELVEMKDEYVEGKDRTVWTVTPNGNGFDIVGEHFETWTLSGEIRTDLAERRVNVSLKGVNGSMKTVKNVDKYVTSGNGHTGTGSGTYTDNAGNTVSADAFTNEYLWSADGSLTVTLKGKGGKGASKTFDPTFVIVEGGQKITKASEAEAYVSYTYTNTVNAVYGLEGKEIKLSATDTRELRVEKEVEVLVGKLVAAGMSVVPAHQEGNGFADGSGKQSATMNITLIREDGSAAPIVYAFEVAGTCQLPSDDQLKNAKFFAGSYDGSYDSALYNNGEWVPAVAHDASEGIFYTAPEYGKTRSIRNETLNKMWGWRNGNLSTQVSDYTIKVTDGVCTIWYGSQIVKQFR